MRAKLTGMVLVLIVVLITASGCTATVTKPATEPRVSAEPREGWTAMVKNISIWQNGEEQLIDPLENPKQYIQIGDLLIETLHKLNLQAKCVFSEERVQEIKRNDTVVEILFKQADDYPISQWVEPEERYHIPVDEKGYRILENVETAVFVLQDNLEEGLTAHVLVGSVHEGKVGYSCWAIKQKESNELDKSWVREIASLYGLKVEIEVPPPGEDEMVEIHRVSQEESQEIARNYLLNCPTFRFDGIKDTVELAATNQAVCPYCWQFVFEFQCQHAGYSDRTVQTLAEVITSHTAWITVDQGKVVSAIMDDDKWDMIKQKMIEKDATGLPEPKPIETVNPEEVSSQ